MKKENVLMRCDDRCKGKRSQRNHHESRKRGVPCSITSTSFCLLSLPFSISSKSFCLRSLPCSIGFGIGLAPGQVSGQALILRHDSFI